MFLRENELVQKLAPWIEQGQRFLDAVTNPRTHAEPDHQISSILNPADTLREPTIATWLTPLEDHHAKCDRSRLACAQQSLHWIPGEPDVSHRVAVISSLNLLLPVSERIFVRTSADARRLNDVLHGNT